MKKSYFICLIIIISVINVQSQEKPGPEAAELLEKIYRLDKDGEIQKAMDLLDEGLAKYDQPDYDRYFLLNYKFIHLTEQKRYNEALEPAMEKANIIKSPKQALNVAETYLRINDKLHALQWIKKGTDRGLQSYSVFNRAIYDPLRNSKQFNGLIDEVKQRNGIGLPAKSFTRKNIDGNLISLSNYKGKVVLVDFWATWCKPCIAEIPQLKKCYDQFNESGFEIIGFSEDHNPDGMKKYLKTNEMNWETVFCPLNNKDETVDLYEVENIPASFLIDKNGILREVNLTGHDLENAIQELVNE